MVALALVAMIAIFLLNRRSHFRGASETFPDIDSATYDSVSKSTGDNVAGIAFSDDGTTMYVTDGSNLRVYQYTLSTAWNLSTASYASKNFLFSGQNNSPGGLCFKPDGTKMYLIRRAGSVFQYSLSTPWDISTASYDSKSYSPATQASFSEDVKISSDGTTMLILDSGHDAVYQYTLSTPWDVSTASYDSKSLSVGTQDGTATSFFVGSVGKKLYVAGDVNDTVYQYNLTTGWDVSTGSYSSKSKSIAAQVSVPTGLWFKSGGTKMYAMNGRTGTGVIHQYSLG